jgi:Ankyrin repeat
MFILLIIQVANVRAQAKTPLHLASQKGQSEVVRVLIEHGTDITAQTVRRRYIWCRPNHLSPGSRHGYVQKSAAWFLTTAQMRQFRTRMGDPLDLASGDERLAELAEVAHVLLKHIV